MRKFMTLLVCFTMALSQVMAQNRTVTGRVADEGGKPLAGATVLVKGTTTKTTTSTDGRFSISVGANAKSLEITYIGFDDRSISLTRESNYTVSLKASAATNLDEVVVSTGITRLKKSEYTGAVAHVSSKDIANIPQGSFDQMLQGKAPGVQVLTGSGQPGTSANVIIRGLGSILGGNSPLYVIDGVPVEAGVFQSLNPGSFESIDILKDAAATSLYGSRGSAGVIVITTKKGVSGKAKFSISEQYGQTFRPEFTYTMMNTAQLFQSQFDMGSFFYRNGNATGGSAAALPGWQYSRNNPTFAALPAATQAQYGAIYDSMLKINTNWDDQFFRTGNFTNTNLTISGGAGKTTFISTLGYYNEQGVTQRTDLKRVTLNTRIDYEDDKFRLSVASNLGYSKRNFQESATTNSLSNPFLVARVNVPYAIPKNPDGSYATGTPAKFSGADLLESTFLDQNYTDQIKADLTLNMSYRILRDLTVGMTDGIDYRESQGTQYGNPAAFIRTSSGSITGHSGFQFESLTRFFSADIRPYLTYKRTFAQKHEVEVSAYGEYVQQINNGFNEQGFGVDPKRPNTPANTTQGNGVNQLYAIVGGNRTQNAIVSGLVTGRYVYNKKYSLIGSYRTDGTSQLPDANRWTGYYSIGGIWEMSKENFLRNVRQINSLRLRVSYGGSGNANNGIFGDFGYLPTYTTGAYSGINTIVANTPGNLNLKWETTYTLNIGTDFSLFNNRVYGNIEYYNKRTVDAYATLGLSSTGGFGNGASQFVNAGIVRNRGFEYALNVDVIRTRNFTWTVNANGSYNANLVLDLGPIHSFTSGTSLIEIGKPLGSQYSVKWGGVDAASGAPLYYDLAGKLTTLYSASYQQNAFGTWVAPWNGGFGSSIRFKAFDFAFNFSYQQGSQKLNNVEYFTENPVGFMGAGYNQAASLNFWKNPGDKASTPSPNYGTNFSSKLIEDASFLRLKNVTLSYTLPRTALSKLKFISNLRFYVMGQNLLIWTKWRGYDPESGAPNIVLGEYPNPRSITGGLELAF